MNFRLIISLFLVFISMTHQACINEGSVRGGLLLEEEEVWGVAAINAQGSFLEVQFEIEVDGSTVNAANLIVTDESETRVRGHWSYNTMHQTAIFIPQVSFTAFEIYRVEVTDGVKDKDGEPVEADSFRFITKGDSGGREDADEEEEGSSEEDEDYYYEEYLV